MWREVPSELLSEEGTPSGVAAISRLRNKLADACDREGLACHIPPMAFCTDNAAMVAGLGCYHFFRAGRATELDLEASVRGECGIRGL